MNRDSRDELLIGYIEDDLPQAERQRVEKLLRDDSAYAKRHEELAAADRQFYLVAERA
jgi:anti-sigma factor RsiW